MSRPVTSLPTRYVAALMLAHLASGCAPLSSSLPAPVPTHAPVPTSGDIPLPENPTAPTVPSPRMLNLTPMTTLADNDRAQDAEGGIFTNSYTRVLIYSSVATDLANTAAKNVSIMPYKPRDAIQRYLVGKKFDMNLSVKMKIGAFEATAPLVTLSHQSDSNGEQWSRSLSERLGNFPLFLVKGDGEASVPTFQIKLAGSKTYNSNMIGKSLDLVVAGLREVAPEAGVLTSLTADSARSRSRVIDTAIGQLFANGMSEEHVIHRDFLQWNRAGGVVVSLKLPSSESQNWEVGASPVGSWTITFEAPRPSIFSDWKICPANIATHCADTAIKAMAAARTELSASQVLNYSLLAENRELATIENLMTRHNWYLTAVGAYSNDAGKDAAVADGMCTEIQNSVVRLGLNSHDADVVTWAFIRGKPAPPKMHPAAFGALRADGQPTSCRRALDAVGD